jgi:putative PEP-CTERM system histidine kinase
LREVETCTEEYQGLVLPEWLSELEHPWLIIPLHGYDVLLGFVILSDPLVLRAINWEDRDLLKTAAKQIASHLTVLMTSAQLAEAKQFEVFSRLSAYMVHDLKNIAAELDLVALNAKKHVTNPEFIEDAFETVENAAGDINRLLAQLRNRRVQNEKKVLVDLATIVADVVASKQHQFPPPKFHAPLEPCQISIEKGRLANVLAHLIDNAQQATKRDGEVTIMLSRIGEMCCIEIKDNGHGMDEDFIRDRLFKPFDTTKGNAGMGIGMYESREFIRQLGGEVHAKSNPGKGSIISLHIPVNSFPAG